MGIMKLLRRQFIFVFFTTTLLLSNGSIVDGLLDAEQDDSDGFWNDDFQNTEYVSLNNCEIVDGSVQLKNESTGHLYDFKSTIDRAAYSYPFWLNYLSPTFFPPTTNLLFAEEFTPVSYSKIKNIDEDTSTTSGLILSRVTNHFRFKIEQDIDSIAQMNIFWRGKAENEQKITFYFWQPMNTFGFEWGLGRWDVADVGFSNGTTIELRQNFSGDLFIDDDGYVDLSIVAIPVIGEKCTVYTDYINITVFGQGHLEEGSVISDPIDPDDLWNWELFTFDEFIPSGTSIKYHILYENRSFIEDSVISGNKNGFASEKPLLDINASEIKEIRLMANLSSDNPSITPKINSWSVLWQTEENTWEDMFNSKYRIEDFNSVKFYDGMVSILSSFNNWNMFGRNSKNMRSSEGYGPQNNNINWYTSSSNPLGGKYKNPIINNGILYIFSNDGNTIYAFNATVNDTDIGEANDPIYQANIPYYEVDSTPLATDDSIIFVTATSNEKNKIVALKKNNLNSIVWEYTDPDGSNIRYCSSPVILDDNIYLTSCGGNNKITVLDIDGNLKWQKELSAPSFSSPAVSDNIVICGVDNSDGNSLYAFNVNNGLKLWNISIGSISRSCPVIYDDKVFVVVKKDAIVTSKTEIISVDISDGSIIWNHTLSESMSSSYDLGENTPCLSGGVLYAASPDGTIRAYDTDDGTQKWKKTIYDKPILSNQVLTSSPCYADGLIYVGTPDGKIVALKNQDGEIKWEYPTESNSAILASPIVVDGLLYVCDQNGILYSIGTYREPDDQDISGEIVSIPIFKPDGYEWDSFFANSSESENASIKFSILTQGKSVIRSNVDNGDNVSNYLENYDVIRLKADFSAENSSDEALIRNWSVIFMKSSVVTNEDNEEPIFYEDSFKPKDGWTNTTTPLCSIITRDKGSSTLTAGLNIGSAKFNLRYTLKDESGVKSYTGKASSNAVNGTKSNATLYISISQLDFSEDIEELDMIRFYIEDLAETPNYNYSDWHSFQGNIDSEKPYSYIDNGEDIPSEINTTPIVVTAKAFDNISDVDLVTLYYKSVSSSSWTAFSPVDYSSPYTWSFTAPSNNYELCTIAKDLAGNVESFPSEGDVSFIFDPIPPSKPVLSNEYRFDKLPEFSIVFSDDYKLETVEYRLNFVQENEWFKINTDDIDSKTYTGVWSLSEDEWDNMVENQDYYIYFRLTDSLKNVYETTNVNDALKFFKDFNIVPIVSFDISDLKGLQFDNKFKIDVNVAEEDNIDKIELEYSYSEDNETWNNWTVYNKSLSVAPFVFNFTATEGSGFYRFKTIVYFNNGDIIESDLKYTSITLMPLIPIIAVVVLFMVLIIVSVVIIKSEKKPIRIKRKKL